MILFLMTFFLLIFVSVQGVRCVQMSVGVLNTKNFTQNQGRFCKKIFTREYQNLLKFSLEGFSLVAIFCLGGASCLFFSSLGIGGVKIVGLIIASALALFGVELFLFFLSQKEPEWVFYFVSPFLAWFIYLFFPVLKGGLYILNKILQKCPKRNLSLREQILEWLESVGDASFLEPGEHQLLLSMVSFKDRITREIMVPRLNLFAIPVDSTIEEALQLCSEERYSRIPVYKETIDEIIGLLYLKDLLVFLAEKKNEKFFLDKKQTVSSLVQPALFTPETKKISHLLQEFRAKKTHLAIVINEYGGTEGVITIEDILEELVGEIADETDLAERAPYTKTSSGWIIEGTMNILDLEKDLGISLPQNTEYDTLGGFIFHRAGTIPEKGWCLHLDDFEIKVLNSNARSIKKVQITPHQQGDC